MEFTVEKTPIRNVLVVRPEVFQDQRGFFSEVYRQDKFRKLGLPEIGRASCRERVYGTV